MPRFLLHIPAWHHASEGDQDRREIPMRLDHLPRENEQIEVPNGGIVEVTTVRHRPQWTADDPNMLRDYGPNYAYGEVEPEVFTCWVAKPEGAPKTRSRVD
jgi:hypothetical protein